MKLAAANSSLEFVQSRGKVAPDMQNNTPAAAYENYASLIAPAAAGCALGILFGRGMRRGSSNVIALTLLAAGAAIAAPVVTDIIQRAANRPGTERGNRRRLEGIRAQGVLDPEASEFFVEGPVTDTFGPVTR